MWACPAEVPGSTAVPALPAEYMTRTLGLTARAWNGISISRRISDGYVNATAMCQAGGKRWPDYIRLDRSQAYIAALSPVVGICTTGIDGLVHVIQGGPSHLQGTWVHPRLAVDLARWISPQFAVWMDGWFLEEVEQMIQSLQPAMILPAEDVGEIIELLCRDISKECERVAVMAVCPSPQSLRCGGESLALVKRRAALVGTLLGSLEPIKKPGSGRATQRSMVSTEVAA